MRYNVCFICCPTKLISKSYLDHSLYWRLEQELPRRIDILGVAVLLFDQPFFLLLCSVSESIDVDDESNINDTDEGLLMVKSALQYSQFVSTYSYNVA